MSPLLLPRYLLGSRPAILALAANRWTPLVGVLLCLSAGLARSYDGEDLLHEPWHLLRPLGAAVVGATLLFFLLRDGKAPEAGEEAPPREPPVREAWPAFLGLYLMTAPIAWLYAVPFKRFLDPLAAAKANLWLLGFVAAWRVLLLTRVAAVLWGRSFLGSFFSVMLFCDVVVLVVLIFFNAPVISVMGGLRLEEREALVNGVKLNVIVWGLLSLLVWVIGHFEFGRTRISRPAFPPRLKTPAPMAAFALAALSVLAWLPVLPFTQPEQLARTRVERLVAAGDGSAAVAFLSARTPADFPPGWSPPPHRWFRYHPDHEGLLNPIDLAIAEGGAAPWVAALYMDRLSTRLRDAMGLRHRDLSWAEVWEMREGAPEDFRPVTPEQAEAAALILRHAPDLDADTTAALRRVVAEAAANPRIIGEDGPGAGRSADL